jgi:XrtJ-associated TM-motif-TM protein
MKRAILLMACIFSLAPVIAHAQGGCVDSPESPTPVLALAGCVGFGAAFLLSRKKK